MNRVASLAEAVSVGMVEQIEVVQFWGKAGTGNALVTKQFACNAPIAIGENTTFMIPDCAEHELVQIVSGETIVVAPKGASVFYDRLPHDGSPIKLTLGHVVDIEIGAFTFRVTIGEAPEKPFRVGLASVLQGGAESEIATSGIFHAAMLAALAFFMPSMSDASEDVTHDQILSMKTYLEASAERDREQPTETQEANPGGQTGQAAQGEQGQMGKPDTNQQNHWSAKGDAQPKDVTLSRERALREAAEFGMIGLLSQSASDPNAPIVPWGTITNGADEKSHNGNMWATDIGDGFGNGGLSLSSTGEGGGGPGQGIGLDRVGTIMNGTGTCPVGQVCQGHGTARVPMTHVSKSPTLTWDPKINTNGQLPAEVIQRIIRQNAGQFIACYQDGLRTNPSLAGRVAVQFMIGRDGSVTMASDTSGSDLADMNVRQCVVKRFYNLSFPSPSNGTVRVVYPFTFTPASS